MLEALKQPLLFPLTWQPTTQSNRLHSKTQTCPIDLSTQASTNAASNGGLVSHVLWSNLTDVLLWGDRGTGTACGSIALNLTPAFLFASGHLSMGNLY